MDFPAIEEAAPPNAESFNEVIRPAAKPIVFRGLVKGWPIISKGGVETESLRGALKAMSADHTQQTIIAAPELSGKLFYNDDYTGQNYDLAQEPLHKAIDRIWDSAEHPGAPTAFIQSILLSEYMPSFIDSHAMPLVPAGTSPRAWIGHKTTVQTHFDLSENIACVVAGRRRFTLFPPDQLANLYIGPLESAPGRTPVSTTNLDAPDFERHPGFKTALIHATSAELGPSDAIYIPPGWFHHVRALAPINMLVNYWWSASGAQVSQPWAALLHAILAFRGLPKNEREVWNGVFAHFAFSLNGDPMAHMPKDRRGIFGGVPDEHRASQIYQLLEALGPEVGIKPPPPRS